MASAAVSVISKMNCDGDKPRASTSSNSLSARCTRSNNLAERAIRGAWPWPRQRAATSRTRCTATELKVEHGDIGPIPFGVADLSGRGECAASMSRRPEPFGLQRAGLPVIIQHQNAQSGLHLSP
jgi:hypothetical protein